MNGYDLIKTFYDRVAELPEMQAKCKTQHLALYTWLCELHNRTKREVMDLPRDYTMSMCFIGSPNTFKEALEDLNKWQLIEIVQRGNNQWQTTKVKFACINSYQQDTGTIPAAYQQDTSSIQADTLAEYTTKRSKGSKVETNKSIEYPPEFEVFWKEYAKPSASKKDAFAEWNKLKPDEKLAVVAILPAYLSFQPEAKYRKDPERFFKNRTWENDFNQPLQPINGQHLNGSTTTKRPEAATIVR